MNAAQLRVIDALVAEHIMGWPTIDSHTCLSVPWKAGHKGFIHDGRPQSYGPVGFVGAKPWSPSTNIAAAWEIMEKMKAEDCYAEVSTLPDGQWYAQVSYVDKQSDSPTLAICLAALAAKGIDTDAAIKGLST